jgi:hypothetical protein
MKVKFLNLKKINVIVEEIIGNKIKKTVLLHHPERK